MLWLQLCLLWVSENIWTLSVHIVSKPSFTEMEPSLLDFFTKMTKSVIPECPNQSVCKENPTISDKVHKTCPEQIPRNKKPPWNQYKQQKLDVQTITTEVATFSRCCAWMCFNFITWQTLLMCRIQYVGLVTTDNRRIFLDRYLDEHCIRPSSFSYQILMTDQSSCVCCAKT